jgi:Kef-type K+ transport system membrane component KefB
LPLFNGEPLVVLDETIIFIGEISAIVILFIAGLEITPREFIGAQVDLRGININILYLAGLIVAIAIITKLAGCGIPSLIFLKDKAKAMKVGVGMISRGEIGLIIAGVGVSSGVLTSDIYTSIIIMVAATTIITPIWLKIIYKKEERTVSK